MRKIEGMTNERNSVGYFYSSLDIAIVRVKHELELSPAYKFEAIR